MSDQHDGGVYYGMIPQSYIDRAKKETGLKDIQYILKKFPRPSETVKIPLTIGQDKWEEKILEL